MRDVSMRLSAIQHYPYHPLALKTSEHQIIHTPILLVTLQRVCPISPQYSICNYEHKNSSKVTNLYESLIRHHIKSQNLSLVEQSIRIGEYEILVAS